MTRFHLPRLGESPASAFPPSEMALQQPNGLLAWGGGLEPQRLLRAYRLGIFPWYSEGQPVLWWTPDPRCVLDPARVHLSRRLRRRYHQWQPHITADRAFEQVIEGCAQSRPGQQGTWITAELTSAFVELHRQGWAHSVEVWEEMELVGGIYGLAIGRAFFGESMFSAVTDASKIALVALCRHLHAHQFEVLDCQVTNPHLLRMGAHELPRREFEALLRVATADNPEPACWRDQFAVSPRW